MVYKQTKSGAAFNIFIVLIYGLFAFVCLFPFYYIIINTISANDIVARGQILFFPTRIHFSNYAQVIQIKGFFGALWISVARTALGTLATLIAATFMGYAISRPEYWRRKFWYRFIIITMYFNAGLIPWYLNMKNLGLLNNFLAYVLPCFVTPFNIVLVKTYIESIPSSLDESAAIDGAGYLTRYFKLILPLAKPIIATIAVFAAVGQWNSFMDTVMLMPKGNFRTLQFILWQYLNQISNIATLMKNGGAAVNMSAATAITPVAIRFTVTTLTVLPILIVYPFFQRFFVKGIMLGAVKG